MKKDVSLPEIQSLEIGRVDALGDYAIFVESPAQQFGIQSTEEVLRLANEQSTLVKLLNLYTIKQQLANFLKSFKLN